MHVLFANQRFWHSTNTMKNNFCHKKNVFHNWTVHQTIQRMSFSMNCSHQVKHTHFATNQRLKLQIHKTIHKNYKSTKSSTKIANPQNRPQKLQIARRFCKHVFHSLKFNHCHRHCHGALSFLQISHLGCDEMCQPFVSSDISEAQGRKSSFFVELLDGCVL